MHQWLLVIILHGRRDTKEALTEEREFSRKKKKKKKPKE
jgi:hypothetical protein